MLALREALAPAAKVVTRELPVVMMRPAWAAAFHSTSLTSTSLAASSFSVKVHVGSLAWAAAGAARAAVRAATAAQRAPTGAAVDIDFSSPAGSSGRRLRRGAGAAAAGIQRDLLGAHTALLRARRGRRLLLTQRAHEPHHPREDHKRHEEE